MLDIRRLRVLQAVAHAGSFVRAAKELGYTQPAISHHIARLEAEVGTALVTRLARGVELTDAGAALAEHAEAVLTRLSAAEEEVATIAQLRAGRVRLAAFPSGSATLVPTALAGLRTNYPGIEVTFLEAEPDESLPKLRAGDLDLVLGFAYSGVGQSDGRDYEKVPLLEDPLHAVLPKSHPRANDPVLDLGDLAGDTWIAGCERCRGHLLYACQVAGFQPTITFATDDYVATQALIATGMGIALISGLVLSAVRHQDVVVRPLRTPPARTIEAVLITATRRPPAVTALLDAVKASSKVVARGPAKEYGVALASTSFEDQR